MQPLAAPCSRLTAPRPHSQPLAAPPEPNLPPFTGEHAYAKVDGAHVWLDHYDARAGSGGVDVCGGPTPERRMRIPVTATVPHNARRASRLAPRTPLIFEHLYSLATAHSPAHTFTPPHPPPGSLTPHCIPYSSVNISFGSTLQPAAGGAGCEASWAVDNVEVHTR